VKGITNAGMKPRPVNTVAVLCFGSCHSYELLEFQVVSILNHILVFNL